MLSRVCIGLIAIAIVLSVVYVAHASKKGTTDTDDGSPGTAFAHVYQDGNITTAKGKVHATRAARHGAYAIQVSVGSQSDGAAGHYTRGQDTLLKWVRDTADEDEGSATAWISGHNAHGEAFFCYASE